MFVYYGGMGQTAKQPSLVQISPHTVTLVTVTPRLQWQFYSSQLIFHIYKGCGYSDTPLRVTLFFRPEGVTVSGEVCNYPLHWSFICSLCSNPAECLQTKFAVHMAPWKQENPRNSPREPPTAETIELRSWRRSSSVTIVSVLS